MSSQIPAQEARAASLTAMLAEYETLRTEVLEAISHRVAIMNFTFAAMSVLLAGLLARKVSDPLAGLISLLAIPQFAHAGLVIWLGEYRRSQRASVWLSDLERRINALTGEDDLGWEGRSEGESAERFDHMSFPYVATAALLLGAAYVAIALGGYLLFGQLEKLLGSTHWYVVVSPVLAYSALTECTFLWFFRKKWRECRLREVSATAAIGATRSTDTAS